MSSHHHLALVPRPLSLSIEALVHPLHHHLILILFQDDRPRTVVATVAVVAETVVAGPTPIHHTTIQLLPLQALGNLDPQSL
jgi:CTP:molybdopterin cytidylyltransferase MocA